MPRMQPTLPELQSVSQPQVLTIFSDFWKSPSPCSSAFRIARRDHPPAVNKNLRADLLRHHLAVGRYRAALWRRNAVLQADIGRVLRRVAQPAPPQYRLLLNQIVQPCLADLRRRQV